MFWPMAPQTNPKDPLLNKPLLKILKRHHCRGKTLTTVQVTEHYISVETGQVKQCTRDLSLSSSSVKVTQSLTLRETPLFKICLSVSGWTINNRTFFELRKHKCRFPTHHWWSIVQPMRDKYSIVCICKIPCCLCSACLKGKGHDKSSFTTRTKAMSEKSDHVSWRAALPQTSRVCHFSLNGSKAKHLNTGLSSARKSKHA